MEIAPGIHRIEADMGERWVYCYLLAGDERVMLVDSGLAASVDEAIVPYLADLGIAPDRIELVLTSHADVDHTGGNGRLARLAPRAVFACHALDRQLVEDVDALVRDRYEEFAPEHGVGFGSDFAGWVADNADHVPAAWVLQGGERLRLGSDLEVELLHVPGHSRGHLAVWAADRRTAIVADAVLGRTVPGKDGRPAIPPTYRFVDSYLGTIGRLAGLDIELLATGHFPVMRGEQVAQFLADSRAFVDELDERITAALGGAELTLAELIDRIDREAFGWPPDAHVLLVFALGGHLERMEQQGGLVARRGEGPTRWRLA